MKFVRLYMTGAPENAPNILRQTPGGKGIWKAHQFYINEGNEPYDYLVVFSKYSKIIRTTVPKERRIFIAGEPPQIKHYPDNFLNQFGTVISSHESIKHPNAHIEQQGYPWYTGIHFENNGKQTVTQTYDDYKKEPPAKKTNTLSVVCSNKSSRPGHKRRYEFVNKLKAALGDELALFGKGLNSIANKSDAIRPYQYHIVIENGSAPHYWSEKLADCYLDEAYPFYAGCPEIGKYFPKEAYTLIDLDNVDGTIQEIRNAIKENRHLQSQSAIKESKRLVLEQYNMFNLTTEYIEKMDPESVSNLTKNEKLYPKKWFQKGLRSRLKITWSDWTTSPPKTDGCND